MSWQVIPKRLFELIQDPDADRARRATAAMMQMKRLDVATMEKAADGG